MARRRERRAEPRQDRRRQRVGDSTPEDELSDSGSSDRKLIIIFVVFFIVIPAVSVLVYSIKYGSSEKRPEPVVIERGLIKSDISFNEILHMHSKVEENPTRHYDYPVLAYITPWNSRGYEMAKRFNSKFTHLSPVWYDLKSQGGSLILEGRHNADKEWLLELRVEGEALVLPRVVLEAFPQELLKKKEQWDKAIDLIVTECKEMEYDGIVLESWSRWAAYGILHDPEMRNLALKFVKELGHALHSARSTWNPKQQLQLVYVIGPPYSENLQQHDIRPEELQSLSADVDGFSLMTYDFSPHNDPGPNAPLSWIRSTLKLLLGPPGPKAARLAPKIFLGINFFGNDFVLTAGGSGGGAIIGRDYLSLLEKHKPIFQWARSSGEHLFFYSDDKDYRHAVFYPTLMSISLRLEEARSWGTGISIWEIGQGLDYFFDLL